MFEYYAFDKLGHEGKKGAHYCPRSFPKMHTKALIHHNACREPLPYSDIISLPEDLNWIGELGRDWRDPDARPIGAAGYGSVARLHDWWMIWTRYGISPDVIRSLHDYELVDTPAKE